MLNKFPDIFFDILSVKHFLWYDKNNMDLLYGLSLIENLRKRKNVWYQTHKSVVIHAWHID